MFTPLENKKISSILFGMLILFTAVWLGRMSGEMPLLALGIGSLIGILGVSLYSTASMDHLITLMAIIYSATFAMFGGIQLPGYEFQLGDIFTGSLLMITIISCLVSWKKTVLILNISDKIFILFFIWTAFRFISAPVFMDGVKDIIFFSLPVLVGVVTKRIITSKPSIKKQLPAWILFSSLAPFIFFFSAIATGNAGFTNIGLLSPLGVRTFALYLTPILGISLMKWRTNSKSRSGPAAAILTLIIAGVIISTMSRTVTALCALVYGIGFFVIYTRKQKLITLKRLSKGIMLLLIVVVAIMFIMQFEFVQNRWFYSSRDLSSFRLSDLKGLRMEGRENIWPIIFNHAKSNILMGHGTGAVRSYVGTFSDWDNPHNDYLRLFHDTGAIGLGIFLLAWVIKISGQYKKWKSADRSNRSETGFAMLGICLCLITLGSFLTDNTLVYMNVMIPVFMLLGINEASQPKQQPDASEKEPQP